MLIRSILLKIGAARNTSLESSVWGLARHCHPGHSDVPDGSQTRALQGSLQHSSRSGRSPSLPACPIPWLTWRAQLLEDRRKGMGKATLSLTTPTATLWVSPASPVTSHSASLSPHSQAGDCWSSNKVKLTVPFNYWWFPLRPTTLPATGHPGHSHSPLSTINILIETWKLNPELFTVRLDTTLLVLERALHRWSPRHSISPSHISPAGNIFVGPQTTAKWLMSKAAQEHHQNARSSPPYNLDLARPQHSTVNCSWTSNFSAFEAIIKKNI